MGDISPPTAADYAQAAANDAHRETRTLQHRVEALETLLRVLGYGPLLDAINNHPSTRRNPQ